MSTMWGARRINYLLHVEPRRDLVIAVLPDLTVHVRAPSDRPLERIVARVDARRSWITRQLKAFESTPSLPTPRFVSGETLFYRGRQYRLRLERRGDGVSLKDGRLVVRVTHRNSDKRVRAIVASWYRMQAMQIFHLRVAALQREISILRRLEVRLSVRRMSRRWGSCTAAGTISINPMLIQTPLACIDYVLVHEMLHLIEPAHSPRFHRLLDRAMPDWRKRKQRLAESEVRWL